MRIRTTAAAAALIAAGLLAALTACGSGHDEKPASKGTASALSEAEREAARRAAGLPPEPSATARYAFLEALDDIDERISKPGTDEQAVSRGLNQCSSIKSFPDDRDKLVKLTLDRFTIPTLLPDINNADTGGKILDAVHHHLCPDF
ncbi:hypothetical protein OHA98_40165 [Streptomyces sp. NBC_00654]|uniref:hypothetical protein n=1 Tax=Streptomyces sp. NBC_00654 TaxID=2975799 RepID=UPI002259B708|nr:hypothetical protein [Streptomyces sp. NBC_00654]MCX4970857.1 hypothetical protein [Streptomyces sp. NBC_00654]